MKVCSLCLKEILDDEISVEVEERFRHLSCSEEYDFMIDELKEIYENRNKDLDDDDIYMVKDTKKAGLE